MLVYLFDLYILQNYVQDRFARGFLQNGFPEKLYSSQKCDFNQSWPLNSELFERLRFRLHLVLCVYISDRFWKFNQTYDFVYKILKEMRIF